MRVLLILRWLLDGNVSPNLMWATLFHDLGESVTGDVPANAKWANGKLTELLETWENEFHIDNGTYISLTVEEQKLLNLADKLELAVFCTEQINMGNVSMKEIRSRGLVYDWDNCPEYLKNKISKFAMQANKGERNECK
jgi:5'-deoxynucleotidase YfbR-like HD superfamily hydrolase